MAPLEFRLPDVGEGIDAAEIVEWHVAVGDEVVEDQPLADIQTDKAIVVIPCPATGTVLELRAAIGDTVEVGAVLAVFGPAGTPADAAGAPASARALAADAPAAAQPRAAAASPAARPPAVATTNGDSGVATIAPPTASPHRPLASPAVRRLARASGLDLHAVDGSGPGGRITRSDVEALLTGGRVSPAAEAPAPAAPGTPLLGAAATPRPAPRTADETVPLRGTRRAIARTLTESWQTIPHVIDYRELDAGAIIGARRALKARAQAGGDERLARALTVTPLVVKMVASALPRHPYANAAIDLDSDTITLRAAVHVGVAMAAPQGLVVPVVHDADHKSVAEIGLEVLELADAARANRLTPAQLAGATITVNNYGPLGIWLGTPIIAPGQAVNFGLGKLEDRPVVRGGEIVARPIVPIAVSGDHRLLDGHTLAAFVTDVAASFEDPISMLGELR